MRLPTLFVPHGAPTFALHPGEVGAALVAAVRCWPIPRAILVVSAHWETLEPTVGGAASPLTVHDFYGFSEELYALDYPAVGDRVVAERVVSLLRGHGFAAQISLAQGLDHAVWIPLRMMYPTAEIPVIPMSVQSRRDAAFHAELGRALAPLLSEGVLLVASGNLTHNLRHWRESRLNGETQPYVEAFSQWIWQQLQTNNTDVLLNYREYCPDAVSAHPTEEHLLPFFVALGAAGADYRAERLYHGIDERVFAMDSFALWPVRSA